MAAASCSSGSSAGGLIDATGIPKVCADQSTLQTLLTIGFGLAGGIAVLFIVIGGLKYITAQGDPAKITSAKNTILYAAIGLVIAGMAEAIITFVINFGP